jgi:hypothetical protein
MSGGRQKMILNAQLIACPACRTQVIFRRTRGARIETCGFESYSLECHKCGVRLAGIIDPCKDELLLSQLEG